MKAENITALEKYRPMWNTYLQVQVIPYFDEAAKHEVLTIIQQEFDPGYSTNLWCGPCLVEMLKKAFWHLDDYYAAQAKLKLDTITIKEKAKRSRK